jgi:hypothetical protein
MNLLTRLLTLLLLALMLTWSSDAGAVDIARTYADAVEMYQAKRYDEALPLFRGAYDASRSPNARLFIARCLRELGDLPAAYEEMKATVDESTAKAAQDNKYAPTRDSAAAELAMLEPRVGKLIVAIADLPADTKVRINLKEVDAERLGRPIAVNPGSSSLVIEAPGKQRVERSVDVPAGETRTVALVLEDTMVEAPIEEAPDESVEPETSGGELRIAGYVVTGVGLVGVAVFAILANKAKSDFDELDQSCGGQACPEAERGRVEDGRSLTTIANITLGVGAVAVAAGVAMIIFGGPDEVTGDAASLELLPMADSNSGGLTLRGSF